MTVKTLKKQLAAAIAMVFVSVIALSSSTYAWFASNNTVRANGMKVQAVAEGGIEINFGAGSYSTVATAGMNQAQQLYPTSTQGLAEDGTITSDWYHASASAPTASAAKAGTYSVLSLSEDGEDSNEAGHYYFIKKEFNIRAVSAAKTASNLKVKEVAVSSASKALDKSLRVAVVCGDNTVIYAPYDYAPVATETGISYLVATEITNGERTQTTSVTALFGNQESSVIADTVPNANGVDVSVYIWFEGEDANHFSNNLTETLDAMDITIDFEATI